MLARRRPDDGILGEEGTANRDGTTGLRWVVDPLDGTVNYLSGIPLWCVSIACEDAAGTLAGVVYDPLRGQTFAAVRGGPARVDEPCARERDARRARGRRDRRRRSPARPRRRPSAPPSSRSACSARTGQRRALGTAALELAWAAAGRIDVVYHEQRIHPWDVDAGLFICQRAGLRVHRLEPLEPELAPRYLAAPPDLAAEVLELVGPSAKERRRARGAPAAQRRAGRRGDAPPPTRRD